MADGPVAKDAVVGEARWPMVGAVLTAIVLTILLPAEVRLAPRWLLPLFEGILLVALIVGDPVTISRRSRLLQAISIALVVGRPVGDLARDSRTRDRPGCKRLHLGGAA